MIENVTLWNLQLVLGNRNDYFKKDIKDITKIGYLKKKRAKTAICWLLSKASHSAGEIADHFEMSPELVKDLLIELTKSKLVVNDPENSTKYYLKSNNFYGKEKDIIIE